MAIKYSFDFTHTWKKEYQHGNLLSLGEMLEACWNEANSKQGLLSDVQKQSILKALSSNKAHISDFFEQAFNGELSIADEIARNLSLMDVVEIDALHSKSDLGGAIKDLSIWADQAFIVTKRTWQSNTLHIRLEAVHEDCVFDVLENYHGL